MLRPLRAGYFYIRTSIPRLSHDGYTLVVRRLRIILPVTALLIISVVFIWPHFDRAQNPKHVDEKGAPEMMHSRFVGTDKRNNPYTITADRALQKRTDANDVELTNPLAEMTTQSGSWVAIRANHGNYEEEKGVIALDGDVRLFHDEGYEVFTTAAEIDLNQNMAWGNAETHGHGPRGTIQGSGFRLVQDGNQIIFTGPTRLVIEPETEDLTPSPATEEDAPIRTLPVTKPPEAKSQEAITAP